MIEIPQPKFQKVLYDSVEIAYTDTGEGKHTLLFIHGLANSNIGWQRNIAELSKHYRCIAIDLPGNGLSQKAEFPYGMSFFAETVGDFIREMNLSKVTLIGHSMGGQIALTMAYSHPGLVEKLVLVASAGLEEFAFWEKQMMGAGMKLVDMFGDDKMNLRQTLNTSFFKQNGDTNKIVDELVKMLELQPPKHYKRMVDMCVRSMVDEPVWEVLPRISIPTLILFGGYDALIPNRMMHPTASTASIAKQAAKRMPRAKSTIVPTAGHFVHWEQAERVDALIKDFVDL